MIAYIKGKVVERGSDYIVVETYGIGIHIFYPERYPAIIGEDIMVHTYQHVREDANDLFGFVSPLQKDTFLKLISVKGVGPKTALNIMASIDAEELIQAIEAEDITTLKKLPGIGPKSAKQIVLDLKGKLAKTSNVEVQSANSDLIDALEGLKQLGYTNSELKFVEKELSKKVNLDAKGYLQEGLKLLAKRMG